MAKQTFTTGQVLTAAQMTSLQETAMTGGPASTKTVSYVLVAADAGTRVAMNAAGSTTITVNTGLFSAGDTVSIQNIGAGVCTVTAGTATVNTSGSLVLAQYQGGILYFTSASAAIFFQFATPASGDIEGVTAGTGISGGGTSGTVTITNSMATEITAKADLIVGTGNATFDNLPVGTNGHVLTADSTVSPTGLKWAAPAAGGFVGCSVYDTNATQSIATGTDTVVTFNSEFFDTDGFHSTASNTGRITIPSGKGGKYLFIASAFFVNLASGKEGRFYKNGNQLFTYGWTSASGVGGSSIVAIIDLVATDYIEFRVVQSSGGNADLYKSGGGAGEYAYFQCQYLGA